MKMRAGIHEFGSDNIVLINELMSAAFFEKFNKIDPNVIKIRE